MASTSAGSSRDLLVGSIYHERQEAGSMLCGNHALNNLLQSQLWTANDLAEIARQLDTLEDATFDEALRAKRRGRSANYDDSGFFSIQVLDSALNQLDLHLVRWRSNSMRLSHPFPESQSAFILNRHLHWLTLRRFNGDPDRWYNLDSCAREPVWIGKTYLGMTLEQAEREGYSVFVVRPLKPGSEGVEEGEEERPPPGESFLHACQADEAAFQFDVGQAYGVKASSATSSSSSNGSNKRRERDDDDHHHVNGNGVVASAGAGGGKRARLQVDDEEEELRKAIAASLLDDPPPAGTKDRPVELDSSPQNVNGFHYEEEEEEEEDYGLEEDEDGGFLPIGSTSSPTTKTKAEPVKKEEKKSVEEESWDEPSPEELRRKRLARFG